MTSCDDCGQLTRHPEYQRSPYWIRCPRCQDRHERLHPVKRCKYCGAALNKQGHCPVNIRDCGRGEPQC